MYSYDFFLTGKGRKLGLTVACLGLMGVYCFYALRVLRADLAASTLTPAGLARAAELEPGNASHWSRLGRYRFFVEQDVPGSIPAYETAAKLNPHAARYWLDLAAAYAVTGRSGDQERALREAVAADPKSPKVAWEAASFYLIRGDAPEALRNLRIVVEGDRIMRRQALMLAWRTFQDASLLLKEIVPADPAAHWDLLQVALDFHDMQAAGIVWDALIKLNRPFLARQALPWVNALLSSGDAVSAEEVWRDLVKFDPGFFNYVPPAGTLVVNGGFEEELLNAGLDWRHYPERGIDVSIDRDTFHFGTRSLRIDFAGRVPSRATLSQVVPVQAGTEYEISGFLKAEHLQTAVGASLIVRDARTQAVIARSAPIDSSTGWLERSATFQASPDTSAVEVGIGRAYDTNTLIKGTLWLDDVKLTPR